MKYPGWKCFLKQTSVGAVIANANANSTLIPVRLLIPVFIVHQGIAFDDRGVSSIW